MSKQWDETKALALGGAIRIVCQYFTPLLVLESWVLAWKLLLEFVESSLLLDSEEVILAGAEALDDLMAECGRHSSHVAPMDTATPTSSDSVVGTLSDAKSAQAARLAKFSVPISQAQIDELWSEALLMMDDVVSQLGASSFDDANPRRRATLVRMPVKPMLTSKSLHRLMVCMGKHGGTEGDGTDSRLDDLQRQAASIDRLVHASTNFEQPLSFVRASDGSDLIVAGILPAQSLAMEWFNWHLVQWEAVMMPTGTTGGNSDTPASVQTGVTLLLLFCLRYLPDGAAAIAESGGHPLLRGNDGPILPGTTCLPLARAALKLLLQFFDAGYEAHFLSVGPDDERSSIFLFAVRTLGRCAEGGPVEDGPGTHFSGLFLFGALRST